MKENIFLSKEELEKVRRLGIIDETALRNVWISREIERRFKSGEKKFNVMRELAEKNCISFEGLHSAIYRQKNRQKNKNVSYLAPITELK